MELTDNEKNLIDTLKDKGLDKDSMVATMLELKTEDNFKKVLQWLNVHTEAGQEEIFEYIDELIY